MCNEHTQDSNIRTFQYGVGPGDAGLLLLFSFSFSPLRAGEGSRLLRILARLFMALDFVTFVEESIVDGNDMRCFVALLDEL